MGHGAHRARDHVVSSPTAGGSRTARDRFGGGGKYPIVEARVRDGVVVAFDGWIGAGGG